MPIRLLDRLKAMTPVLARLNDRLRPPLRHWGDRLHRRRRTVAVIVSLGVHVLFVALVLVHAGGSLSGGGHGGSGPTETGDVGYSVDLVAVAKPAPDLTQVIPPATDEALDAQPAITQAPPDLTLPVDIPPVLPAITAAADSAPAIATEGGAGQNGATSGTSGDLWAAIAPCWKRIATADTLPVTLEITFSADGHLAKPPVIDRQGTATPAGLQSEAQAIAALAQCGAYPMAAGQTGVKVDFPAQ